MQPLERLVRMPFEKGADAEFRGEKLRERVLRPHGILEVLQAGGELGPQAQDLVLLQIGLQAMGGRTVENTAHLALKPVHLHGMTRAQLVALHVPRHTGNQLRDRLQSVRHTHRPTAPSGAPPEARSAPCLRP